MSYDMLEPGQGTFVLRRWLHVSGAEPVKRPGRSMERRLGTAGRFAVFTESENHEDALATDPASPAGRQDVPDLIT